MKSLAWFCGGLVFLAALPVESTVSSTAKAVLYDAKGQKIGEALFTEEAKGVRINLEVSHLAPGVHGIHIHSVGRCDPPDFLSSGPHFNPFDKHHGLKNPLGPHAGDLPNLVVGPDGHAQAVMLAPVTLGPGPGSLFDADGSALIIHAGPDDEQSDPAGNSGGRIAGGILVRP